jgi:histidinol-phosphate/aromatic aminotransferase/cobyric acid decarboxylase-like protein
MRKIAAPYTDPSPLFRHGGAPQRDRGQLLDFSASINPLGPPESVLRALRDELPNIAHYPDPECQELTERLAVLHGVAPSQVVVGNGSNELIYAIARAFRPKHVAIAEPTYTEYLRASLLVGAKVDHWLAEGNHFKFTTFDPEGADIVWLANPNNPTGGMWAGGAYLTRWIASHPESLFVMDEAFLPLRWENFCRARGFPPSLIWYMKDISNLIVLNSFTKMYALPGLRLGYAVASVELTEQLRRQLVPWSVNCLAQRAGLACLDGDPDYRQRTAQWLNGTRLGNGSSPRNGRADGVALKHVPRLLRALPSHCNFFLARLKGVTSDWLRARLAERGIAIRDASNFVGLDQRYVRIAIRTPAENARLFEEIESILANEASSCRAR